MSLRVLLDTAQPRIVRDRVGTVVTGRLSNIRGEDINGWIVPADGNCFIEPTLRRLILCPAPLLEGWETTTGGIYARLQVSDLRDYNGGTPAALDTDDWKTGADRLAGDYWIGLQKDVGNPGITIVTDATYDQNRGFFFSDFNFSANPNKAVYRECGWYAGTETPDTGSVKIRLFNAGDVWIYRYGQLVATGELTGPAQAAGSPLQKVGFCIIPMPPRDLVILSTLGQGFAHTFLDIDPEDDDPVITGAASRLWVRHPAPQKIKFQIAPMSYPSSGYISGETSYFREAPGSGTTPTMRVIYNDPGYGGSIAATATLKETGSSTDFTPDGSTVDCQVRVTLTGDGTNSPIVHAATADFDPEIEDTYDLSLDLMDYLIGFSLDVPEQLGGTEVELTLKSPGAIEDAGASMIASISNRPILVEESGWTILSGVTGPPRWADAYTDEARRIQVAARDWCKLLETNYLGDDMVHDGGDLRDEFLRLLKAGGIREADTFIDDPAFTLPASQSPSQGDFSVVTKAGTSVMAGFLNLIEGYCPNWFTGVIPNAGTPQYQVLDPEGFGDEPALVLYRSIEDAVTVGGYSESDAWMFVVRNWNTETIEPEANEIWVTGVDPRTGRPLVAVYSDDESKEPGTAPDLRPSNWLGQIRRYGIKDTNLSSMDACIRAAELLAKRLIPARKLDEFDAEILNWVDGFTIWRSALLGIYQNGEILKTRVMRFKGDWEKDPTTNDTSNQGARWRPCHYVCERSPEDISHVTARYGYMGATIRAIKESQALKLSRPNVFYRNGGERLEGLRPQEVVRLPL